LLPLAYNFLLRKALCANEVALQPEKGITAFPLLHLLVASILRGIVGSRMGAEAVGEPLDQRGSSARAGPLGRELDGGIDGKDVVAVYADAGETVRERLFRECFARALLGPGQGYRP